MQNRDEVVKHLEMIQAVISRLARNSFMIKGWSMTLVVATVVLMTKTEIDIPIVVLMVCLPVLGFWILDGYFIQQERLYRALHDKIRKSSETDFNMSTRPFIHEPKCGYYSAFFSKSLAVFYSVELIFIFLVFWVLQTKLGTGFCIWTDLGYAM